MESFWGSVIGNVTAGLIVAAIVGAVSFLPKVRSWLEKRPWAVGGLVGGLVAMLVSAVALGIGARTNSDARNTGVGASQADVDAPFPIGAVIAFAGACPPKEQGWGIYEEGKGRFIVGAGDHQGINTYKPTQRDRNGNEVLGKDQPLPSYSINQKGGEPEHKLTSHEMPAHNHEGETSDNSGPGIFVADKEIVLIYGGRASDLAPIMSGSKARGLNVKYISTEHTHTVVADGGDQAHNNLPPYIALSLCQYQGTG